MPHHTPLGRELPWLSEGNLLSLRPSVNFNTFIRFGSRLGFLNVIKVHPRTSHESPDGEHRYSYIIPLTWALQGRGWSTPRAGRFTYGKQTRCPLYRKLDGPQDRSGRVRKISLPNRIRSPHRPTRSGSLYRLR